MNRVQTDTLDEGRELLGPVDLDDDSEWLHKLAGPMPVGTETVSLCGCKVWTVPSYIKPAGNCRQCPDCIRLNGGPW